MKMMPISDEMLQLGVRPFQPSNGNNIPVGGSGSSSSSRSRKVIHYQYRQPPSSYLLTMKETLERVQLDHSYATVLYPGTYDSKHQSMKYILGPPREKYRMQLKLSYPGGVRCYVKQPITPVTSPSKLEKLLKKDGASSYQTSSSVSPTSNGSMSIPGSLASSPSSASNSSAGENHISIPSTESTKPESKGTIVKSIFKKNPVIQSLRSKQRAPTLELDDIDLDAEIDVVSEPVDPITYYDPNKAKVLMTECEKYVKFARNEEIDEDWESKILKNGWTKEQEKLFSFIVEILHEQRLVRLSHQKVAGEPAIRRAAIDASARKMRTVFASIKWNTKLIQWLHAVLFENLSHSYLSAYLDLLQTLRSKTPVLVDRMMQLSNSIQSSFNVTGSPEEAYHNVLNNEALTLLLKRPWDPFHNVAAPHYINKLPSNPIFLFVPYGPCNAGALTVKRHKSFVSLFSGLGKVMTVSMKESVSERLYVPLYAEQMLVQSKNKLKDVRLKMPNRPIYLVGWGPGAIVACTVALTECVSGVIALGFPLFGILGNRGAPNDPLFRLKVPTLFVIGGRARNSTAEKMDKFRRQLDCETSMIMVGSADDYLKIGERCRKRLLVTQSYVDKLITDEVSYFVNLHSTNHAWHSVSYLKTDNKKIRNLHRDRALRESTPGLKRTKSTGATSILMGGERGRKKAKVFPPGEFHYRDQKFSESLLNDSNPYAIGSAFHKHKSSSSSKKKSNYSGVKSSETSSGFVVPNEQTAKLFQKRLSGGKHPNKNSFANSSLSDSYHESRQYPAGFDENELRSTSFKAGPTNRDDKSESNSNKGIVTAVDYLSQQDIEGHSSRGSDLTCNSEVSSLLSNETLQVGQFNFSLSQPQALQSTLSQILATMQRSHPVEPNMSSEPVPHSKYPSSIPALLSSGALVPADVDTSAATNIRIRQQQLQELQKKVRILTSNSSNHSTTSNSNTTTGVSMPSFTFSLVDSTNNYAPKVSSQKIQSVKGVAFPQSDVSSNPKKDYGPRSNSSDLKGRYKHHTSTPRGGSSSKQAKADVTFAVPKIPKRKSTPRQQAMKEGKAMRSNSAGRASNSSRKDRLVAIRPPVKLSSPTDLPVTDELKMIAANSLAKVSPASPKQRTAEESKAAEGLLQMAMAGGRGTTRVSSKPSQVQKIGAKHGTKRRSLKKLRKARKVSKVKSKRKLKLRKKRQVKKSRFDPRNFLKNSQTESIKKKNRKHHLKIKKFIKSKIRKRRILRRQSFGGSTTSKEGGEKGKGKSTRTSKRRALSLGSRSNDAKNLKKNEETVELTKRAKSPKASTSKQAELEFLSKNEQKQGKNKTSKLRQPVSKSIGVATFFRHHVLSDTNGAKFDPTRCYPVSFSLRSHLQELEDDGEELPDIVPIPCFASPFSSSDNLSIYKCILTKSKKKPKRGKMSSNSDSPKKDVQASQDTQESRSQPKTAEALPKSTQSSSSSNNLSEQFDKLLKNRTELWKISHLNQKPPQDSSGSSSSGENSEKSMKPKIMRRILSEFVMREDREDVDCDFKPSPPKRAAKEKELVTAEKTRMKENAPQGTNSVGKHAAKKKEMRITERSSGFDTHTKQTVKTYGDRRSGSENIKEIKRMTEPGVSKEYIRISESGKGAMKSVVGASKSNETKKTAILKSHEGVLRRPEGKNVDGRKAEEGKLDQTKIVQPSPGKKSDGKGLELKKSVVKREVKAGEKKATVKKVEMKTSESKEEINKRARIPEHKKEGGKKSEAGKAQSSKSSFSPKPPTSVTIGQKSLEIKIPKISTKRKGGSPPVPGPLPKRRRSARSSK